MAKSKQNKPKKLYDQNGNWVEEKGRIKGAIRRTFRLSPQFKEAYLDARVELPPALKKNGKPGKKNQVRFKCARCLELYSFKNVQADHIDPVVPLHRTESDMTYDEIARGIFCKKENLQILCSTPLKKNDGKPSCHRIKTDEENFIRSKLHGLKSFSQSDIEYFKGEFKEYLAEKEKARLEKEERKRQRELKKLSKSK